MNEEKISPMMILFNRMIEKYSSFLDKCEKNSFEDSMQYRNEIELVKLFINDLKIMKMSESKRIEEEENFLNRMEDVLSDSSLEKTISKAAKDSNLKLS